jgi:hypothetical protein
VAGVPAGSTAAKVGVIVAAAENKIRDAGENVGNDFNHDLFSNHPPG